MNQRIILFLLCVVFARCRDGVKAPENEAVAVENEITLESGTYPPQLQKVFEVHGGLDLWKQQRTLSYEIPKKSGIEIHTIDLYSREDIIEASDYRMGFDGKDVWLLDPFGAYQGDPVFYHNLMFYFYAMPFVLADDGIEYFETEPLVYEGKEYPGIGIRYQNGVGTSPEDEYYLHYDPDTYQMAWLGYTVTYRTGERSDDVHWIRYDDWTNLEGIVLPKSITWHLVEEGKIGKARNTVIFENIALSKEAKDKDVFAKPEAAEVRLPVQPQ
ncbi:DUF6503 family protein [Muriicola sp.]|uniref:DUF6503 family protein n=1 Tax=Muriicola sp. TaxID=2020856 RepID=UPI003C766306